LQSNHPRYVQSNSEIVFEPKSLTLKLHKTLIADKISQTETNSPKVKSPPKLQESVGKPQSVLQLQKYYGISSAYLYNLR